MAVPKRVTGGAEWITKMIPPRLRLFDPHEWALPHEDPHDQIVRFYHARLRWFDAIDLYLPDDLACVELLDDEFWTFGTSDPKMCPCGHRYS